jgi:hypothetical protein
MAPASPFPEIPMDQVQANEVEKSYHLMYKHIAKEFVHWDDLKLILQNGNLQLETLVNGGAVATQIGPSPVVMAQGKQVSTQFVYQEKAQGLGRISQHEAQAKGLAVAQEATTTGISTALGV